MRSIFGVAACGIVLVSTCGCRSAAEGSSAADVAQVSADVARRTGTSAAVPTSCGDAEIAATCGPLLSQPLTAPSAVKIALLQNRSVREAYEGLGIARADLVQAGLISNPVFSANAKLFSHGPEIELGLAQSFVDLFFVPLRRRVAAADLWAAQASVARELVGLVYDVRRALLVVRGADEVVRVRREALRSVTAARDLMKKLHDAGNVRDADLTVEEVGVARAQIEVDDAELRAREARATLGVLLGCGDAAWRVEGTLPPLSTAMDTTAIERRAIDASLDLLEAKAQVQAAMERAGLACREGVLPQLDLGAVGKRESSDGSWGFGPAVSTAIPIFDHGQAKVLAANALARQRLARHDHLSTEIAAAARRFADRAKVLRARETYVRETYLPLRIRLVNETVQTFNAMQIGAFDVLDAKEGETDARREHVETRVAAWLAQLDLAELLAGRLDRERLEMPHLPDGAERPTPPKGH